MGRPVQIILIIVLTFAHVLRSLPTHICEVLGLWEVDSAFYACCCLHSLPGPDESPS
jgi:hypothetical protein